MWPGSPGGGLLYVADQLDGRLPVVDPAVRKVVATIRVGRAPSGVATDPRGDRVYVTGQGGGAVAVIDPKARRVPATVRVGAHPSGLAVAP
jgi:YVTN family beta-propeller protein